MVASYKNFWSLNIDEAITTGLLREYFNDTNVQVFMPLNAYLKDIDLILVNMSKKKVVTLQVKGSRAYETNKGERKKYGDTGSVGWFFQEEKGIRDCVADYFIFLIYVIEEGKGRKYLSQHTITIKPQKLYELCKEKKILHGGARYSFYIWIIPEQKRAFDYRDATAKGELNLDEYLDEKGLERISKDLQN